MGNVIFWHRRDLRINDNSGLYHALKGNKFVQSIFIFDSTILDQLPKNDQRVQFIYKAVQDLKHEYQQLGSDLLIFYGDPKEIIPKLSNEYNAQAIYTNRDYEPSAIFRDKIIFEKLSNLKIEFKGFKDQVIFDRNEILKNDGKPYTIFTPYSKKWKEKLDEFYTQSYPTEKHFEKLCKSKIVTNNFNIKSIGFHCNYDFVLPSKELDLSILKYYDLYRDYPFLDQTSKLSVHLRFGTISIRELVKEVKGKNEIFLNELIWREFYQMILYHFPNSVNHSFKKNYDYIQWENDEVKFNIWREGKTGYPIVDAGMRELNATGFMHNRVRMIVASFLVKHLQVDWRWGEAYFALKLLDYEQASNVGGWQWASSGCDAVPYFRIFNPFIQQEKFDKDMKYIKKWIPEYGTNDYPTPIVDHKIAREKTILMYKEALNKKE